MSAEGQFVIRDLERFSDYQECARLQQEVWSFPEAAAEVVPASCLVVMHHYGGICVGAFEDSAMVGFVVGFLGARDGRLLHHSHMLAVLAAHRGRGIGAALKWAQRDRALAQGINLVNWTFDPLQAPNASFNINRLGAVTQRYMVDVYGASESPLHGGLATDRFEAEWWVDSARVRKLEQGARLVREGWQALPRVNRTRQMAGGFRVSEEDLSLELDDEEILVEVPLNVTEMMAQNRTLAHDWRAKTRRIFQNYLPRYCVEGFHRADERCYYRMVRSSS